MSIVFVVLGLGFLAGGAYAVIEGWPYLLIERGFTLVIIGTVLMTAGVVMLALSRVLAELARIRSQLSNAVMALSVASMSHAAEPDMAPRFGETRRDAPEGDVRPGGSLPTGTAIAAGGALAAGAALASTRFSPAEATFLDETTPRLGGDEAAQPGHGQVALDASDDDEPDLFMTQDAAAFEPAGEQPDESTAEPGMPHDVEPWTASDHVFPEETAGEADYDREIEPDAEIAPASDDPLPIATPHEFDAALAAATTGERLRGPAARIEEDFDRLRDRLAAARYTDIDESLDGPALTADRGDRDLAGAEDWMTAVRPGQQRWASDPVEEEAIDEPVAVAPEAALAWPPQTREALPFDTGRPLEPESPTAHDEPAMSGPGHHDDALAFEVAPAEPEPLPVYTLPPDPVEPEPDPEPVEDVVEPPAPAASDEGVVGAYQVGRAHFTLYADGSIKARTPEGDYSFASMDELKVYLASEKSRIGV